MPIQTRCPSCAAAVPPTAAWCSLCHADLRPRPAPPVPAPTVTVVPGAASAPDLVDSSVSGRHAAAEPVDAPSPGGSGGRHAARGPVLRTSSRTSPRSSQRSASQRSASPRPATQVTLEGIDVPTDGEVSPEKVDELAEQMLARLAISETGVDVLDPETLPGGKWGFAAGLMVALVLAFIIVSWVVVHLVNR